MVVSYSCGMRMAWDHYGPAPWTSVSMRGAGLPVCQQLTLTGTYVMVYQAQISHSIIPLPIQKPQRGRKVLQLVKAFATKSEKPELPGTHMN